MIRKLLFVFIFATVLIHAQVASTLEIIVRDASSGGTLQGAVIKFEDLPFAGVTNGEGRFVLKNMPPGEWRVICSYVGYKTLREVINVSGDKSAISFNLNQDVVSIPEVVVTGNRASEKGSTISFSNLSKAEIERLSVTKDIPAILNSLPSTSFYSESGTGIGYGYIRIRGFDQRRISVLVNGVPQNDPEDHSVYWLNFYDLANSLEDVQVQRGAALSFYGPPSIGASINLVTNKPFVEPGAAFEVGSGSFNTRKYSLSANSGLLADRFMIRVRGTKVETDGYREWSWAQVYRFFVSASYFDDVQSVSVSAFGGPQEDGLAFYGISKKSNNDENSRRYNYGLASMDREVLNQPQISLVHDLKLGENLWLKNTLFFMSGDGFFDFNASYGSNSYFRIDPAIVIPSDIMMRAFVDNDQYGWLPQIEYRYTSGKLLAGGEIRIHRSLHWGRIESGSGLPSDITGDKGDKHFYEYRGGKDIYSGFVGLQHNLNDKLGLSLKLQMVYQKYRLFDEKYVGTDFSTPYLFVNPQAGISYRLTNFVSLYGSVALTKREPPLKNLYEAESASWGVVPQFNRKLDGSYDFSDPLVKPETLLNIEVGTRLAWERFNGSINFYYMNFENEIVPSGGLDIFGQPRVGNAGRTLHLGIEIEGTIRLPWHLQVGFNGNISRNRYVEFTEYDGSGSPLSRVDNLIANAPEFILNASLEYAGERFFAGLHLNHTGVQYTDNSANPERTIDDEVTVDPFTVVNLSAGVNYRLFTTTIRLTFELNNLFDKKYLMNGFGRDNFFPAAGRNLMTTLKVEI